MGTDYETMKRRAAEAAASSVEDGMVVGLGTGSTAAYAISALGEAVEDGLDIIGVPTSDAARQRARSADIPVAELDMVDEVDIAIDGADQACDGVLIKGGGGAHTKERLVDTAAHRFIVVVDERKVVGYLDEAVALEVLPPARRTVQTAIDDLGGVATVRSSETTDGPAYTERGNLLLDADFGQIEAPRELARSLSSIPGILDHGLFVDIADALLVGTPTGVENRW